MKSHSKASPQRSCLAARSCWRFSPTRPTPASARAPISSSGTYLAAARISTLVARRPRAPARGWPRPWPDRCRGSAPPSQPFPGSIQATPAWRPVRPCVAAVGEEQLRLAAGAEAGRLDLRSTPASPQQPPRDLRQVEHAAVGDPVAERGEGVQHLVADLVAAGPDPGPDRGVRSRRPPRPRRRRSRRPARASRSAASPPLPAPTAPPAGSRRRRRAAPGPARGRRGRRLRGSRCPAARTGWAAAASSERPARRREPGGRSGSAPGQGRAPRRAGGGSRPRPRSRHR